MRLTRALRPRTEATGSRSSRRSGNHRLGAAAARAEPAATPELLGADPNDDLSLAKKYFRQGSYGLAERHFRKAVELHPKDAEAWLGLAASYDRLRRFDLADRAYAQAIRLVGATPEILNNQGFSYMLRGDYAPRAHHAARGAGQGPGQSLHPEQSADARSRASRKEKAVN